MKKYLVTLRLNQAKFFEIHFLSFCIYNTNKFKTNRLNNVRPLES